MANRVKWIGTFGLLAIALYGSLSSVPFFNQWGLDFQNLWAFHNCDIAGNLYDVGRGRACGDWGQRDMLYPPTLYAAFAWSRDLTFDQARLAMAVAALVTIILSYRVLTVLSFLPGRPLKPAPALGLVAMLAIQFPVLMAVERLNNDWVVLFMALIAVIGLSRRSFFVAGFFMGIAFCFKLYPGLAAAIAALLVLILDVRSFSLLLRFAAGGVASTLVFVMIQWREWVNYTTAVLPEFADRKSGLGLFSHSLRNTPVLPLIIVSIAAFIYFRHWRRRHPREVISDDVVHAQRLAVALVVALSAVTLVNGTSFDYNLILAAAPLILLLRLPFSPLLGLSCLGLILGAFGPKALHQFSTPRECLLLIGFYSSFLTLLCRQTPVRRARMSMY